MQIVLKGGASDQHAVAALQLAHNARKLGLLVLNAVRLVYDYIPA